MVLVSNTVLDDIPEAVEVQPLQAMIEIYRWADYAAFDVERENLHQLEGNAWEGWSRQRVRVKRRF